MRLLLAILALGLASRLTAADRPNFVIIGAEDISPNLGCYADPDAITPNLDRLAAQGARFTRAFTHAPVCAPSRSGLITGMYPTTTGSLHMRSKLIKPPPTVVEELRKAGYFIAWPTANGKTDFNFDVPKPWADTTESWIKKPEVLPKDRPFFAYVNFVVSHESQVRATDAQYAKNTARLKPGEEARPGQAEAPAVLPRHSRRSRVASASTTTTSRHWITSSATCWPRSTPSRGRTTRSSSSSATTAGACPAASGGRMTPAPASRSWSAGRRRSSRARSART